MKFDISKPKDITSSLSSDSFTAEIADPKVMMNIVRDKLYAHKLRTPIQEYISNAWDSQVAAGNTDRAIRIVLPTTLEPVLKIRDFGTGMNDEKVRKVFSQYTASDKRQKLNQIGGFGLGSKSAFAYTDKFTIVSYIDGLQNTYLAFAPSELDLEFSPLASEPTTEENGVEIQIAIKPEDIYKCWKYVLRMSLLLPVEPEIINGDNIKQYQVSFKQEAVQARTDKFTIFKPSQMGNTLSEALDMTHSMFISYNHIPYPVPYKFTQHFKAIQDIAISSYAFELKAEMNTLQIPPSREMLVEDEALENFVKEQAAAITQWFKNKQEEEVAHLKTLTDLNEVMAFMKECICNHKNDIALKILVNSHTLDLTVHRERYGSKFELKVSEPYMVVSRRGSRKNASTVVVNYDYRPAPEKGFHSLDASSTEKWYTTTGNIEDLSHENIAKMRMVFKNNTSLHSLYIFKSDSVLAPLIKNSVEGVVLPKNARLVPVYYNASYGDLTLGQVNFSPRKEYCYVEMTEEQEEKLECVLPSWVRTELEHKQKLVIYVPAETAAIISKKKNFTKLDLSEYEERDPRNVKFTKKQLKALMFMEELERYRYGRGFDDFLKVIKSLKAEDIQDPWLKAVLEKREVSRELNSKYKMALFSMPRPTDKEREEFDKLDDEVKAFMDGYPILKMINTHHMNDEQGVAVTDYLNLTYARNTGILKSE